jgi:hypothetical protein
MEQIKNTFRLDLSVSINKSLSKDDGKFIVDYHYYENIPIHNNKRMAEIFSEHLQSTNIWKDGHSRNSSYSHITGVMLDFDNKNGMDQMSINEFIRIYKDVHFVLYPSSNHLQHRDENGLPFEKFRVILPFNPNTYDYYNSEEMHKRVYQVVMNEFPAMDTAPTGRHSKFFPSSLGDEFYVKVNIGNDYYSPKLKALKIDFKKINKVPRFTLDTEVEDDVGKIWKVRDIKEKTSIFCPFCDHEKREGNPDHHNASIELDDNDVPRIFCASCKSRGKGIHKNGVFFLDQDEAYTVQSQQLNVSVFRDILTDKYYLGAKSKKSNDFEFNQITKQNIPNALITRGLDVPTVYEEAEFGYDFSERVKIFDLEHGFVNRFIAPKVLKDTIGVHENEIPKYTDKVIRHFVGGCPDVYDSYINHLAYMVQTGDKLRVAFLFQGVQGTGKGLFFSKVISAIFGRQYCTQTLHHSFLKEFNSWLETNYCLLVDEVEADFSNKADVLARVLKQVIGDKWIAVEGKGVDIKNGCINANLFFGTNKRNGLVLEPSDRRFIIGAWQDKKIYDQPWWLGDNAMAKVLEKEVPAFVAYLKGQPVNRTTLNRVVKNDARELLIDISKTNTEMFFESIKNGDWDWFRDCLINNNADPFDNYNYENADKIMTGISSKDKITRDDLRVLFNNIFQENKQAHSFTRLCKMHGLEIKPMKIDGITQQGVEIG